VDEYVFVLIHPVENTLALSQGLTSHHNDSTRRVNVASKHGLAQRCLLAGLIQCLPKLTRCLFFDAAGVLFFQWKGTKSGLTLNN